MVNQIYDDLFNAAIAREKEYLEHLRIFFRLKDNASFDEVFNFISKNNSNFENKRKEYEEGVVDSVAISILREIEAAGAVNVLDWNKFIGAQIEQIGKADTGIKKAGIVDEANTIRILSKAVDSVTNKFERKGDDYYHFTYKIIPNVGSQSDDFTLNLSLMSGKEEIIDKYYKTINYNNNILTSIIHFENKLNLDYFHIAEGSGQTLSNTYQLVSLILEAMGDIKESPGVQLSFAFFGESVENYSKFYSTSIKGKKIRELLAAIVLYSKIHSSLPIYITTDGKNIKYKLCSEIITEIKRGNKSFKVEGVKDNYTISYNTNENKEEIAKKINNEILKDITKYQLRYGKK